MGGPTSAANFLVSSPKSTCVGAFPGLWRSEQRGIRVKNDFGLALSNQLPALGSTSRALRVISRSWNSARNQLTVEVSGVPGADDEFGVWNPGQISSVDGAVLKQGNLRIEMPTKKDADYLHHTVVSPSARRKQETLPRV